MLYLLAVKHQRLSPIFLAGPRAALRLCAALRPVARRVSRAMWPLALLALAQLPAAAAAHEIPARVAVRAWVVPRDTLLSVFVRVPLEAFRDFDFPERADGSLDFERVRPLLDDGARLWVADAIAAAADGLPLDAARIRGVRLALPGDRGFESLEAVRARFAAPPLGNDTSLPWQHALVDVQLEYRIPREDAALAIAPALARLGVRTLSVVHVALPDGRVRTLSYEGDPGVVQLDPRWWQSGLRFVREGFWHILGGLDHLLFVFCLVLPLRQWRPLVAIVTAFTVAHSLTLGAAALGVAPSADWFPPLVEVAIAVSILWLTVENVLLPPERLARRWPMAFGFGLIHGFGFSFALREELQFAGANLITALAAFNVGVELGQLLVLAAAAPLLAVLLRQLPAERAHLVTWVGSAFVAHAAWHWMTERWESFSAHEVVLRWPALDATLALHLMRAALLAALATAAALLLRQLLGRFLRT